MPRPIVLGNGSLLVQFDARHRIRDLFWPQVGGWNHLNGHSIRMGVWASGRFAWVDEGGWERTAGYEPHSLVARLQAVNHCLGVAVRSVDAVAPDYPAYHRRLEVENLTDDSLDVRLFFTHDLRIMESDIGDTALYHPFTDSIIHYKGPCAFLFAATASGTGLRQFTTGLKAHAGFEGTWRDAEDGVLENHPISQGAVDSTLSVELFLPPGASKAADYLIVCGESLDEAAALYREIKDEHAEVAEEARLSHQVDLGEGGWLEPFSPELRAFLQTSSLLLRTQTDDGGGILAATDSDIMETARANYCYVWPRDGALVAMVYDRLEAAEPSERYHRFATELLSEQRPFFLQKYRPDGAFGASWHPWIIDGEAETPLQEDETALSLIALDHFCENVGEWDEPLSEAFDRMARFLYEFRDPATGLPKPSYDLWEERRGIHTYTTATVIRALEIVGERSSEGARFTQAAEEMRDALRRNLFNEFTGAFHRRLAAIHGRWEPDPTPDSSTLAVGLLGALPPDSPEVRSNLTWITDRLWVSSPVGGLARYAGDYYFRQTDAYPGNPWILCTMWLAQTLLLLAKSKSDLAEPLRLLEWAREVGGPTGVLPEQVHPETGVHLSVSPLTWSHAEVLRTALDYSETWGRLA